MKIVKLEAENVKRVKAVEITPTGNVVQITGKNGQGKSSVLDAIFYALGGGKGLPKEPIRKGATSARVALDLGEIKVTRKFTEGGGTTLVVESAEGARFPSPQKMLDGLIGSISFDPLEFARMDPKAQFDTLRRVAKLDVDIDVLNGRNANDYEKRTEVNRATKQYQAQAAAIVVPDDVPETNSFDVDALLAALTDAGKTNAEIERRRNARVAAQQDLEHQLREVGRLEAEANRMRESATGLAEKIKSAPALPDLVDVDELRLQIETGRKVAHLIERRAQKRQLEEAAAKSDAAAKALTEAMEARDATKAAAIAAAKMPVPDIGFGDGFVTYNGLPFDQASSADQLRTSVAIAMAANAKLRVLRIKEGGLLDEDSMKILEEMAAANDYQCWIETVHANGPVAVEMVDGMAKAKEVEADGKLI